MCCVHSYKFTLCSTQNLPLGDVNMTAGMVERFIRMDKSYKPHPDNIRLDNRPVTPPPKEPLHFGEDHFVGSSDNAGPSTEGNY